MSVQPDVLGTPRNPWRVRQRTGGKVVGGAVVIASALYADGAWGRRRWPSSPNLLVGARPGIQELALSCSGLGSMDGPNHARHASKVLPGVPAYWEYSSDGISIPKLAVEFDQQAPDVELLHLHGHSMGGPMGLELACQVSLLRHARRQAMLEQGLAEASAIPDLKLGRVALNCSPFDSEDGRLSGPAKILRAVKWPVGPSNKFAFSLVRSVLEGKPLRPAWAQAREDAFTGCSPRLWMSQVRTLERINLNARQSVLRSLIGPSTEVWYCRPQDPMGDISVNTPQASEKYGPFFKELGASFRDFLIPDAGHAESEQTFNYLASLTLSAEAQNRFIDGGFDV